MVTRMLGVKTWAREEAAPKTRQAKNASRRNKLSEADDFTKTVKMSLSFELLARTPSAEIGLRLLIGIFMDYLIQAKAIKTSRRRQRPSSFSSGLARITPKENCLAQPLLLKGVKDSELRIARNTRRAKRLQSALSA